MIVVFVVDTSPSMGQPIANSGSSSSKSSSSSVGSSNSTTMLSKLDLAKMAVEDLTKGLSRRIQEHNVFLQHQPPAIQKSMCQIGLSYAPPNQYLLLSTSRQHTDQPSTAACGAGGRLLVGFGPDNIYSSSGGGGNDNTTTPGGAANNNNADGSNNPGGGTPIGGGGGGAAAHDPFLHHHQDPGQAHGASNTASFQRELKQLQASTYDPNNKNNTSKGSSGGAASAAFPDDAGGAGGLNAALSAGLQLLSRYRLHDRSTENFGMGRYPNPAMMLPNGSYANHALQPACLILLTDGSCFKKPPAEGGGSLTLQYGSMPLREWYKEPFRWDQRVICLGIGGGGGSGGSSGSDNKSVNSTQYLHPHLRALSEVTGGMHTMLQSTASLPVVTERLLRILAPSLPRELPMNDPLKSPVTTTNSVTVSTNGPSGSASFVNAGPVCCFQALEGDMDGTGGAQGNVYRAMLLYVPTPFPQLTPTDVPETVMFPSPIWSIPENYFPHRKLDTLPPRPAQPLFMISRFPSKLGNKSFEPAILMKQLHRLDQLILSTRQLQQPSNQPPTQAAGATVKMLHRDVYICEWVSVDDRPPKAPQPHMYGGGEYYPVMVNDAGRPNPEDDRNFFHIGILHSPVGTSTLASSTMSASSRPLSTLTLLPPEPQILVPLLLKAADAEHRAFKKAVANNTTTTAESLAAVARTIHVDETWKQDFRNYISRLPPYYQMSMKRGLRSVLPTSLHPLLATALASESTSSGGGGGSDAPPSSSIGMHCFSKACFQKIRNAEILSRETNERLERQEAELRGVSKPIDLHHQPQQQQQQIPPQPPLSSGKPLLQRSSSQGHNMEVGYGQYDSRSTTESFLSALRTLPAPWLVGADSSSKKRKRENEESKEGTPTSKNKTKPDTAKSSGGGGTKKEATSAKTEKEILPPVAAERYRDRNPNAMDVLGDLPADCLMAYYESRRRWIFGGSGLTTRGLMVEGVSNDGSNVQRCGANPNEYLDQSLLSLAGVGVSTLNETTVTKMGDYRERLLWSRSPVVGYGSNDSCGVAATTAADGSPKWSVDDDVMPMSFFDTKTGMFSDSVQTRVRARLMVNFGNAYKDKRASALVPEKFLSQCPSNHQHTESSTPQDSPPHDSFSSNVEEGEAIFTKSPPPKSPPHSSSLSLSPRPPPTTAKKDENKDSASTGSGHTSDADDSSRSSTPPPPPTKRQKLDDGKHTSKPAPKQPPPQRSKAGGGGAADKASSDVGKSSLPNAPNTPPVAPPKLKSSPGSTPGGAGPSPRPPPPPLKSPMSKPSPVPPPKAGITKRPPPPPGSKRPAPPKPPSLDKRPSFSLAPQKPLPNVALRRPSSITGSAPGSGGGSGGGSLGTPGSDDAGSSGGKKLPAPPSIPKPAKLEATTSGGGSSSSSVGGGGGGSGKPPPPGPQKKGSGGAPPPPPGKRNVAKPPPPKPVEPKPLEYTNKDKRPEVDLPVGWMCVWSKSQRRWYFFDTRSNRSVWEWPPPK